jgi:hypothetical protein
LNEHGYTSSKLKFLGYGDLCNPNPKLVSSFSPMPYPFSLYDPYPALKNQFSIYPLNAGLHLSRRKCTLNV